MIILFINVSRSLSRLGVILVCYALYSLLFPVVRREFGSIWSYLAGLRAGGFGGAFNAAGPPVMIYVSLPPGRQELIKVTLPGCYFASGLMVVAAPAPLTLGIYAGHCFFGKIREATYRRLVLILFLVLGVFTSWNAD